MILITNIFLTDWNKVDFPNSYMKTWRKSTKSRVYWPRRLFRISRRSFSAFLISFCLRFTNFSNSSSFPNFLSLLWPKPFFSCSRFPRFGWRRCSYSKLELLLLLSSSPCSPSFFLFLLLCYLRCNRNCLKAFAQGPKDENFRPLANLLKLCTKLS